MNARRWTLVVSLAVVGGCITDPVTGESKLGKNLSDSEEGQLGAQYKPQILQQFNGAYPDEEAQSYLSGIVLGMAKNSVRPNMPWAFTIVNSSDVNAFAVPGGQLFITRGLLWRLDDEAEFAVVMGHEIGHVEHRHAEQGMVRDQGTATVAQILAEHVGGLGASAIGVATPLLLARYSRDQEREADVQGVKNSYKAGYDPRRGAEVFKKFLALKQSSGGGGPFDAWTSDHPLDEERIATITKLAAETDSRLVGDAPVPELRVQTDRFAAMIEKVRAAEKVYERHDAAVAQVRKAGGDKNAARAALSQLEACAQELPSHAFLANSAGKAAFLAGDAARARSWFEKASGMNQGLLEPEYALGYMSLSEKKFDEAAAHADRGLALLPDNYSCLYLRGEANLGRGNKQQAQSDFNAVMQAAPPDSAEYKNAASRLGIAAQQPAQKQKQKR
jgi:predicted Zn-dependent protease